MARSHRRALIAAAPPLLLLTLAAVFTAFVIRGLSGFGAGLIMTPLLTLLFDLRVVVVVAVFLTIATGFYLLYLTYQDIDLRALQTVLLPSTLGCLLGALSLSLLRPYWLLVMLGVVTILFAVYLYVEPGRRRIRLPHRSRATAALTIGALSGLLQGLYGTGGPPIVMLFSQTTDGKRALRATLTAYFLLLDLLRAAVYIVARPTAVGAGRHISFALLLLLPASLGAYSGVQLQQFVTESSFRRVVAFLLLLSGVLLIVRA